MTNLSQFFIFKITTLTTVGYGDMYPIKWKIIHFIVFIGMGSDKFLNEFKKENRIL